MAFHDCGPLDSGGLPPGQFRGSRDSASCCSTAHRRSKRTYALQPYQACFFFFFPSVKVSPPPPKLVCFTIFQIRSVERKNKSSQLWQGAGNEFVNSRCVQRRVGKHRSMNNARHNNFNNHGNGVSEQGTDTGNSGDRRCPRWGSTGTGQRGQVKRRRVKRNGSSKQVRQHKGHPTTRG